VAVVVLLLGSGFGGLLAKPSVAVFEAQRGRFVRDAGATGILKAVQATPIVVPIDIPQPHKVAWMAKEGSALKAGDPVVTFDPTDMTKSLDDGRSDRDAATSKIGKTRAESTKSEKSLSIDRDVARDELTSAEDMAPKSTDIFSRNEIIESEIDRDLLSKRTAAAEKKLAATGKLSAADLALGEIGDRADIKIRQAEKGASS
jgi:multidrug efflux pump subunit AcrA (membrane-fusion protein)